MTESLNSIVLKELLMDRKQFGLPEQAATELAIRNRATKTLNIMDKVLNEMEQAMGGCGLHCKSLSLKRQQLQDYYAFGMKRETVSTRGSAVTKSDLRKLMASILQKLDTMGASPFFSALRKFESTCEEILKKELEKLENVVLLSRKPVDSRVGDLRLSAHENLERISYLLASNDADGGYVDLNQFWNLVKSLYTDITTMDCLINLTPTTRITSLEKFVGLPILAEANIVEQSTSMVSGPLKRALKPPSPSERTRLPAIRGPSLKPVKAQQSQPSKHSPSPPRPSLPTTSKGARTKIKRPTPKELGPVQEHTRDTIVGSLLKSSRESPRSAFPHPPPKRGVPPEKKKKFVPKRVPIAELRQQARKTTSPITINVIPAPKENDMPTVIVTPAAVEASSPSAAANVESKDKLTLEDYIQRSKESFKTSPKSALVWAPPVLGSGATRPSPEPGISGTRPRSPISRPSLDPGSSGTRPKSPMSRLSLKPDSSGTRPISPMWRLSPEPSSSGTRPKSPIFRPSPEPGSSETRPKSPMLRPSPGSGSRGTGSILPMVWPAQEPGRSESRLKSPTLQQPPKPGNSGALPKSPRFKPSPEPGSRETRPKSPLLRQPPEPGKSGVIPISPIFRPSPEPGSSETKPKSPMFRPSPGSGSRGTRPKSQMIWEAQEPDRNGTFLKTPMLWQTQEPGSSETRPRSPMLRPSPGSGSRGNQPISRTLWPAQEPGSNGTILKTPMLWQTQVPGNSETMPNSSMMWASQGPSNRGTWIKPPMVLRPAQEPSSNSGESLDLSTSYSQNASASSLVTLTPLEVSSTSLSNSEI